MNALVVIIWLFLRAFIYYNNIIVVLRHGGCGKAQQYSGAAQAPLKI